MALERSGQIDAAIGVWFQAQAWGQAVQLIRAEAGCLLRNGRRQTLVQWIQTLPIALRHEDPWLGYWLGRAQLQVNSDQGFETLEIALERFRRNDDVQGRVECLTALIGGAFVGFAALPQADRWLDELLGQLEPSPFLSDPEAELRTWAVLCMALFHVRPWHPMTMSAFERVEGLLPKCKDPNVVLGAAAGALIVSQLGGHFDHGNRIVVDTEDPASQESASPAEAAWWHCQVGYLRYVQTRYDEALEAYDRAARLSAVHGLRGVAEVVVAWRFHIEYRVVGWPAANATLAELEATAQRAQPMTEVLYCNCRARHALHIGQHEEAAKYAIAGDDAVLRCGSRFEEMLFGICFADILIQAGRVDDAIALIERSRALIERSPAYDCWRAVLLFTQCWAAVARGNRDAARRLLHQALVIARHDHQRYYLRYLDCALGPLLQWALEESIEVDIVRELIKMFRIKAPSGAGQAWPWPVRIITLGRFEVLIQGQPLEFSRKVPRKTLLLLKCIVAHGGRDVPEQSLCDAIWDDEEADAAHNALSITILRLRRLLGSTEAVVQQGGTVSLNPGICWVDAWHFEAWAANSDHRAGTVMGAYGGTFLPQDVDERWSVIARERLRGKFVHLLSTEGTLLEARGDFDAAMSCYLRGIDADPIVESFYQGLMRCCEKLGRRSEAFGAYRRLKQMLSVTLGVPPSESTEHLYTEMLSRQRGAISDEESNSEETGSCPRSGSLPIPTGGVVTPLLRRRPGKRSR